ncbi:uncharacterized protein LOC133888155 isoform X2 [Phragmites australis]|uniref:uncharacterized protein LOC133888155 isoform X2 n=1 Tax=Phragmites australis TaxID=29695 RepID=UPI002D78A9D9|nr:uncharacterized protein LOC133888155 isoform X2 [Phragmites australis]
MAAPPSPQPRPRTPTAHSAGGGDGPVSLFLDTDLGTRLALLVAPDTTIRHLKSLVAGEHAAAFSDLGPVAVKSFQVRRKGALYHLSDLMTVTSAFTRIKGGCFLHVKMAAVAAAAATHCCQDTPAFNERKSSEGRLGIHAEKRVMELPATISEIASDVLPQRLEVPNDVVLPSSSQLNTEIKKNEAVTLASDAQAGSGPVIDKAKSCNRQIKHANRNESSNQNNIPHVVEEVHVRKEDILHGDGDQDVGVSVSDNKQVRVEEEMLKEIHAVEDLSQEKKRKKARRTGSFNTSAVDSIRADNESDTRDVNKSSRAPLKRDTTSHGDLLNTSFRQEVHENLLEGSIHLENPSTVGKKKKRKRRQLAPSEAISAQEVTKPSTGAVELSKSAGEVLPHKESQGLQDEDAYNVEWTTGDEPIVRASNAPLSSSQLNNGSQGGEHVQLVSDAHASTGLISEQENVDLVHTGYRNPSVGDTANSTADVVASEGKTTKGIGKTMKGSNPPWDGGDNHEKIKQHKHNEESHDEGVVETSNMEKDSKSTNALEKRHTNDNTSQEKKRKKAKKVSSVDMASMETAGEKDMCGYRENAAKSDIVSTEREIVHDPSMRQISSNVQQGNSGILENPTGDRKRKKKRRHNSESSKGVDPSQDLMKSSGFATHVSLIQNTNAAPLDAKQTAQGTTEGTIVSDHKKLDEILDGAAAKVIDEVLADLRSTDSLSMDLDGDLLTGQTHLSSNQNALGLPESTRVKVGLRATLPPKYPAAVHSDVPVSSPSHKKSKGKELKVLSTMIDSSHYSSGVPEEDSNTELREFDSLRFTDKTSDLKDILTGDIVAQADEKPKATKRQRKNISLKQVPSKYGKATQSSDEQVNQVVTEDLKGADATQADLVPGGSVIDAPSITVGKVQQKGKRSSKAQVHIIQETYNSTHGHERHLAKDSQDELTDIAGTHDNENAASAPTELPVVQKDATTLKPASPNARKGRKKSSNSELQSRDSALEHGSNADLTNSRAEQGMVSPKNSADAVQQNYHNMVHPASDEINFLDHFSCSKMNNPSVSAENKQNNEDENAIEMKNKRKNKRKQGTGTIEPNDILESLPPTDKTSLTDHFGTSEVAVPSVPAENMTREFENLKKSKEKKKRKRKSNLEDPAAEKENPNCDHQDIDIGTQDSQHSVVQKGTMGQDSGKENNDKVTQNASMMLQEPEDATCGSTLEKKLHQSNVDSQDNLPIDEDHAHMSKGQRESASQTKPYAKSRNHDESINRRAGPNPNAVSKLVKSFSMSPPASSDSTEGTPQNANRYRVAVRKVPRKRYEQTSDKSKKESRKAGSGAIFNDAISEGSDDALDTKSAKAAMEASSDNSSTSADSGVSSAAYDESAVPDDDGTVSLSQRSLKDGLHIGSILRGSSSYKKARQKQTEDLDDDIVVPDSQPADGV